MLSSAGDTAVVQTKSSPTDVVTEMDRAAEELIRARLLAARPDDAILGEEGGETGAGAEVRWIVDPLDGTVNYLYGLPDWAVSIAAEVDGVVTAGRSLRAAAPQPVFRDAGRRSVAAVRLAGWPAAADLQYGRRLVRRAGRHRIRVLGQPACQSGQDRGSRAAESPRHPAGRISRT